MCRSPAVRQFLGRAIAVFCLTVIMLPSCATVIRGECETIHVSAEPAGSMILVVNSHRLVVFEGAAPALIRLPKASTESRSKESYELTITNPGEVDLDNLEVDEPVTIDIQVDSGDYSWLFEVQINRTD